MLFRSLLFDLGLFAANLTHAAHALGYGTLHVGLFDHDRVAELARVPDGVQVVELMPLGRPAAPPKSAPPRRPVEEFTHRERFGER